MAAIAGNEISSAGFGSTNDVIEAGNSYPITGAAQRVEAVFVRPDAIALNDMTATRGPGRVVLDG